MFECFLLQIDGVHPAGFLVERVGVWVFRREEFLYIYICIYMYIYMYIYIYIHTYMYIYI